MSFPKSFVDEAGKVTYRMFEHSRKGPKKRFSAALLKHGGCPNAALASFFAQSVSVGFTDELGRGFIDTRLFGKLQTCRSFIAAHHSGPWSEYSTDSDTVFLFSRPADAVLFRLWLPADPMRELAKWEKFD